MVTSIKQILEEIETAIKEKSPFSLIRFGDGGLKIMEKVLNDEVSHSHWRQEGIPLFFFKELMRGWVAAANEADYIDTPEHYFIHDVLKNRQKLSQGTWELMSRWKEIYQKAGIIIDRKFCSPEAGLLLFLEDRPNLLEVIKDRSVCIITNFYETERILSKYVGKITLKLIPGFFGNHYYVSYNTIMPEITKQANDYDLWLLGAGEIGRLYSGEIRRCGGRTIDIGKIFDAWVTGKLDKRLKLIATDGDHELLFRLKDGKN